MKTARTHTLSWVCVCVGAVHSAVCIDQTNTDAIESRDEHDVQEMKKQFKFIRHDVDRGDGCVHSVYAVHSVYID